MSVLMQRPLEWQYGYEVAKLASLSSGTLYPLLIRLHQRGFLEARWEAPVQSGRPARHAYRLTSAGLALARTAEASDTQGIQGGRVLA